MQKQEDVLSNKIIGAAIEVHSVLGGPGLLESVYERSLAYELRLQGLLVRTQVPVAVVYKEVALGEPLSLDLLVGERVLVECKAARETHPVHLAQALTYLRLMDLRLALVLNFGKPLLKDGIHRVVNGL